MNPEQVKALIEAGLPGATVQVEGEGNKYQVTVVSEVFAGLSPVKKQQRVYATLNEHIASGAIHAITMQTYTPDEWAKKSRFGF